MEKHYAAMLANDFDKNIREELGAMKGGRFRKYTDHRTISGEAREFYVGGEGNYTDTVPNLLTKANQDISGSGMGGSVRSDSVTPKNKYAYEVMTYEQLKKLEKDKTGAYRLKGTEYFINRMKDAIEVAEDITVMEALEEVDALLPPENIVGDVTKTIQNDSNIQSFKTLLTYASSRFTGMYDVMNVGAFMVIDSLDWAKVMVVNKNNGVFMSSDYQAITGVDGRRVTSVFGVAIEQVNPFKVPKGDKKRLNYVPSGTARICTYQNIASVSWEDSIRTEVTTMMLDNDTTKFGVAKSMGAKVIDPTGVWKFVFKPEALNVQEEV